MSLDSLKNYQSQLAAVNIPVVDQEWVRQCILDNRYLMPERFSIRPESNYMAEKTVFKIDNEMLERLMERIEPSDKMMNYLMNCVIYVSKIDPEEERIQQKLIHMGGGAHMFGIIPNVTHIVSDKYTEDQGKEYTKFSNVLIVSTRWLRECLYFKTRVPESEYILKPIKKPITEAERYLLLTKQTPGIIKDHYTETIRAIYKGIL